MRFKIFYRKKGAEGNILDALLGTALAVGAIFFLLYLGAKIFGLFVTGQEYDATVNNLYEIALQIEKMLKENKNEIQTPYFIDDYFILVGFGPFENRIVTTCDKKEIPKPDACGQNSCLCVFEKDVLQKCIPFTDKVNFAAEDFGNQNLFFGSKIEETDYENLVIYGDGCGIFQTDWNIQSLNVKKDGSKIVFSIQKSKI